MLSFSLLLLLRCLLLQTVHLLLLTWTCVDPCAAPRPRSLETQWVCRRQGCRVGGTVHTARRPRTARWSLHTLCTGVSDVQYPRVWAVVSNRNHALSSGEVLQHASENAVQCTSRPGQLLQSGPRLSPDDHGHALLKPGEPTTRSGWQTPRLLPVLAL